MNIIQSQKIFQFNSNGKGKFKSKAENGNLIQNLLKLKYFKFISNQFGIQQVLLYLSLHLLELYILREGKTLLDQSCQYVFVTGQLNIHGINVGEVIQIEKTGQCLALKDCLFIQVKKSSKKWKLIKQRQSKKQTLLKSYQTKVTHNQEKNKIFQILQCTDFFKQLSYYDLIQLLNYSEVKKVTKNKTISNFNQQINKILFVLQGEIKLSSPIQQQSKTEDFIKKFKINFHSNKNTELTKIIGRNDWIGLEELFSENQLSYKFNSEIISKQASFLEIPLNLFKEKFNRTVCCQTIEKLKGLINSKRKILEKSIQAQQKLKMNKYQTEQIKNSLINKFKSYNNNKHLSQRKRLSSQIKNVEAVPETIVHKFNSVKNNQSLGLNQQRLNLFPQQYDASFMYPNQRRQIDLAKQKKDRNQMKYFSPRQHKQACKSKQKLHAQASCQNILFSLTRKSTQNFIMQSTFYKANQDFKYSNLNKNTIQLLQKQQRKKTLQKNLLIERKKSKDSFNLPYLLSSRKSTLQQQNEIKASLKSNRNFKSMNKSYHQNEMRKYATIQNKSKRLTQNRNKTSFNNYSMTRQKSNFKNSNQKYYLTIAQ